MTAPSAERLPKLTAELLILGLLLEVLPDAVGTKACADHLVGRMRRQLGPAPPTVDRSALAHTEVVVDEARTVLSALCERCGKTDCALKDMR